MSSSPAPSWDPSDRTRFMSFSEYLREAPLTCLFLGACIVVFVLAESSGDTMSQETLLAWGALEREAVWAGQPWRLLTAGFLHIGVSHLAVNLWAMFRECATVERALGHRRFAAVYLGSTLCASGVSLLAHHVVGAGASGAGFGIMGAWWVLLYRQAGSLRALLQQPLFRRDVLMALLWMGLGLTVIPMDNAAHVGGLLAGVLLALLYTRSTAVPSRAWGLAVHVAIALVAFANLRPLPWQYSLREGLARANRLHAEGDWQALLALGDLHPGEVEWQRVLLPYRAGALLELGRTQEARNVADQALRSWDGDPYTHLVRGRALLQQQEPQEALASMERAVALAPEGVESHYWRYEARLAMGETAGAMEDLAKVTGQSDSWMRHMRARVHQAAGRLEEAAAELDAAAAASSLEPAAQQLHCEVLLQQCEQRSADVLRVCKAVASTQPDLQSLMADAHLCAGDPSAAQAEAERVLARDSGNARARLVLARVHSHQGKHTAAREALAPLLARPAPHASVFWVEAGVLERAGNLAGAIAALRRGESLSSAGDRAIYAQRAMELEARAKVTKKARAPRASTSSP